MVDVLDLMHSKSVNGLSVRASHVVKLDIGPMNSRTRPLSLSSITTVIRGDISTLSARRRRMNQRKELGSLSLELVYSPSKLRRPLLSTPLQVHCTSDPMMHML